MHDEHITAALYLFVGFSALGLTWRACAYAAQQDSEMGDAEASRDNGKQPEPPIPALSSATASGERAAGIGRAKVVHTGRGRGRGRSLPGFTAKFGT